MFEEIKQAILNNERNLEEKIKRANFAELNHYDNDKRNLLYYAIESNHEEGVKNLLMYGCYLVVTKDGMEADELVRKHSEGLLEQNKICELIDKATYADELFNSFTTNSIQSSSNTFGVEHKYNANNKLVEDILVNRHKAYWLVGGLSNESYNVNLSLPMTFYKRLANEKFVLLNQSSNDIKELEKKLQEIGGLNSDDRLLDILKHSPDKIIASLIFLDSNNSNEKENIISTLGKLVVPPELKVTVMKIPYAYDKLSPEAKENLLYRYFPKPLEKIIGGMNNIVELYNNNFSTYNSTEHRKDNFELPLRSIIDSLGNLEQGNSSNESSTSQIVIIGPTGAGKSTLTHALAASPLKARHSETFGSKIIELDEENCNPKQLKKLKVINISDEKVSETKIPNMHPIEINGRKVNIWDCPGFFDTEFTQEVTNSFYIKGILDSGNPLKIILTIPNDIFIVGRGSGFVDILKTFINSFKGVEDIHKCISLVVTHVPEGRTKDNIKNTIEAIIKYLPKSQAAIAALAESIINNSLQLFHAPTIEGKLPENIILKSIESSTEYIKANYDVSGILVSNQAREYAKYLRQITVEKLNDVIKIIGKVIEQPYEYGVNSEDNVFLQTKHLISQWLPSSYKDKTIYEIKQNDGHLKVKLLDDMFKCLNDNLLKIDNVQKQELGNHVDALNQVLLTMVKYAVNQDLAKQIIKYNYVLNQQLELIKFFSALSNDKLSIKTDPVEHLLDNFTFSISSQLEKNIKTIELQANRDTEYYKLAIEYLERYPEDKDCINKRAEANNYLGDLYENKNDNVSALNYYSEVLILNGNYIPTYNKIGDLLYNVASSEGSVHKEECFKTAIVYYKAAYNIDKVKLCYKQLPITYELALELNEYSESLQLFRTKHLFRALNNTLNDEERSHVFTKLAKIINDPSYIDKAESKNFLQQQISNNGTLKELLNNLVVNGEYDNNYWDSESY